MRREFLTFLLICLFAASGLWPVADAMAARETGLDAPVEFQKKPAAEEEEEEEEEEDDEPDCD